MNTPKPEPMRSGRRRSAFWIAALLLLLPVSCGLLFPVFWNAKLMPRSAVCKAYLKQIGTALQMYAEDYDNRLPSTGGASGSRSASIPYLLDSYLKNGAVWECPTEHQSGVKDHTFYGSTGDTSVSYGYSAYALSPGGRGVLLKQVGRPAETVAFTDSTSSTALPTDLAPTFAGTRPAYRHRLGGLQTSNVVFADGHAKSVERSRLEETSTKEAGRGLNPGIDSFRYWNLK